MHKLLFLVIIICSFPAFGQENLLPLQQAVDSALRNNPDLNQARAVLAQKENEWRTKMGIDAPNISYFEEGINDESAKPFEERRWTISQTIDFPLTTYYRLQAVSKEEQAIWYHVKAIENELISEVKSRYIEILYALYLQELGDRQKSIAEDLYNAVYTKFETGMANGIDLANAELQVAEADNFLSESEKLLHQARYSLFYLMGMKIEDISYDIQFADTLQSVDVEVSQILALSVLHDQPEYIAALYEYQATENKIKEAKSNILPDISLNLYKQNYGDGFNYNGFEIGLSIPLWLPFEQEGNIKMAEAHQTEIEWKQKSIELDMKQQIEHAWHGYDTSKDIIERYSKTMKDNTEKLLQLSLDAYRLGEIDLLNLLNAQQTYLDNQKSYLTALRDYYLQLAQLEKFLNQELVY